MLAVLITLTPCRQNVFIDWQKVKVQIAVVRIMDAKTRWYSNLELRQPAYLLREFTLEWLKNPDYSKHWCLFTTQDEWTIVKYVMEVLRPFQSWTMWMSKRLTDSLHHVLTFYTVIFDHMAGVMQALAKKNTEWTEDLYFAVKCARKKLSKSYYEVTPITCPRLISAHILDHFQKLGTYRKWHQGMDLNPDNEGSYTRPYQEALLKYVENEYCAIPKNISVRAEWLHRSLTC